jgi:hypothetical protein
MKRLLYSVAVLMLISIPAFAAKNSQTVNIPEAVTVGNTQLEAGDYKVTWSGTGANVQVTLLEKDKYSPKPVTVTARAEDAAQSQTGFTVERQGNVSKLSSLKVGKTTLIFDTSSANGQ